jgi:sodium/potassium-transporting ATPase subunit alpha
MKSIKTIIADEATVIRGGTEKRLSATTLVTGDIVKLSMGDRVPADLRLVAVSSDLKFDRSLLTGERYCYWSFFLSLLIICIAIRFQES